MEATVMPKKLTTEEFIKKAKEKFSNIYDYSLVNYKNYYTPVKIICNIHGEFMQTPNIHLIAKCGCPKCCGFGKTNQDEFIQKAKMIYGDKYDYSLAEYIHNEKKVKIICKDHGIFEKTPHSHISGKQGCKKCTGKYKETEDFIKKAKSVHGDKYDYSLVEYKGSKNKINIICLVHGTFSQEANSHLIGNGCPSCAGKNKTTDEFIKDVIKIHGEKYDYSKTLYTTAINNVIISCKIHGDFLQLPHNHLRGSGCPACKNSRGENMVRIFLINNSMLFESQKKFKDCRYKNVLSFDFYLSKLNTCIEYDGKQHFFPAVIFGGQEKLEFQQLKDQIKTNYCLKNNIPLIRIRYDEDVERVLSEKLLSLN